MKTLAELRSVYDLPLPDLLFRAMQVHRNHHDPADVQRCALLSIKTGGCPEDCGYCSQSARYKTGVKSEPLLSVDEVRERATRAKELGATRFCMGAAWREVKDGPQFDSVLEMVRLVRGLGMEACVTLGLLTDEQARRLAEAGLTAYNHNLDTSRRHYQNVITTRTYDDRLQTLRAVGRAGISVCCGAILGLEETEEDRLLLLAELAALDPPPESIPINCLMPIPGTPLEGARPVDSIELVRLIATARIAFPAARVRLSAGRDRMSRELQVLCFLAGANSIFFGEKLLTAPNPSATDDAALFRAMDWRNDGLRPIMTLNGFDPPRLSSGPAKEHPLMSAPTYEIITPPTQGTRVTVDAGVWKVPDDPIVCLLRGDGIGRDAGGAPGITTAAVRVLDAAVEKAYQGRRKIHWFDVHAGDVARELYYPQVKDEQVPALSEDEQRRLYLPDDTLKAFEYYALGLKGPLTTPIGGGFRSINVYLRIRFDLYACVRPVRYFRGVEAPNKRADKVNMVIFRENTEDVYCGIEFKSNSDKAKRLLALLKEMGYNVAPTSGLGIKPMSPEGTKRLVRMAIRYAIDKHLPSVTIMHKGNIMKFTEGAFKDWGYEVAVQEFRDQVITEAELMASGGRQPPGKVLINDRIADSMFQQIQLRPDEYSVVATPNLNGDYLSDAAAALTGGLGLAAGANIGDRAAMFEATHGTAPKYTGKNAANPGAVLLSGALLLEHIGWDEAATLVTRGVEATFAESEDTAKKGPGGKLHVTYDIARQFAGYGAEAGASSSEFADRIIYHVKRA